MGSGSTEGNNRAPEFMLNEYERIHSLILDEIRQGEQRVSFFMTIASVVGGALLLFYQASTLAGHARVMIGEGVLVLLFIYGMITLNRVNQRIVNLTLYREFQEHIQAYFAEHDSEVATYVRSLKEAYRVDHRPRVELRILKWFRGTLQDLMIFTNGTTCGAIVLVALLTTRLSPPAIAGWAAVTALGAVVLIRGWHYYMRGKLPPMK